MLFVLKSIQLLDVSEETEKLEQIRFTQVFIQETSIQF